jgi:hypothetical protein
MIIFILFFEPCIFLNFSLKHTLSSLNNLSNNSIQFFMKKIFESDSKFGSPRFRIRNIE